MTADVPEVGKDFSLLDVWNLIYLEGIYAVESLCDSTAYIHASKCLFPLFSQNDHLLEIPSIWMEFTCSLCTGGILFSAAAIMYSLSICCLSAVKILILWYLLNSKVPAGVCFLLMYTNSISKQATDENVLLFKCLRMMRNKHKAYCVISSIDSVLWTHCWCKRWGWWWWWGVEWSLKHPALV